MPLFKLKNLSGVYAFECKTIIASRPNKNRNNVQNFTESTYTIQQLVIRFRLKLLDAQEVLLK